MWDQSTGTVTLCTWDQGTGTSTGHTAHVGPRQYRTGLGIPRTWDQGTSTGHTVHVGWYWYQPKDTWDHAGTGTSTGHTTHVRPHWYWYQPGPTAHVGPRYQY